MRRSEVRSLGSVKRLPSQMSALTCGFLGPADARASMGEVLGGRAVAIRAAYVHGVGRAGVGGGRRGLAVVVGGRQCGCSVLCPWFVARRFSAAAGGARPSGSICWSVEPESGEVVTGEMSCSARSLAERQRGLGCFGRVGSCCRSDLRATLSPRRLPLTRSPTESRRWYQICLLNCSAGRHVSVAVGRHRGARRTTRQTGRRAYACRRLHRVAAATVEASAARCRRGVQIEG